MNAEIVPAPHFKIPAHLLRGSESSPPPPPHEEPTDDHFTARLVQKVIVLHQVEAAWWAGHDPHGHLRAKAASLIEHFKITIRAARLPIPLFRVEEMNCKSVGRYNPGVDGYALAGTISFNLKRFPLADTLLLAHLLKYLCCFHRHWMGGSGDFDAKARAMLKEFGVAIDAKGNVTVDRIKGFADFLLAEGIPIPTGPVTMPKPVKGKSTNKPWSCHCQGCMVGTAEFFATCPKCGQPFRPGKNQRKKAAGKGLALSS